MDFFVILIFIRKFKYQLNVQPQIYNVMENFKIVTDSKGKEYKVNTYGTHFHIDTNEDVIRVLEECRLNRTRIVLDLGDTKTGNSWNETYDITGYVGRSTGLIKIPILVYNKRSLGGGSILTHCIIGIKTSKGNRILYKLSK